MASKHPAVLARLVELPATGVFRAAAQLLVCSVVAFAASAAVGETRWLHGLAILIGQAVLVLTCLPAMLLLMASADADAPPFEVKHGFTKAAPLLLVGALVWSVGSIQVLMSLAGESTPASSLGELFDPSRMLFFTGACAMALLAAIMEEILFRGGLHALMERMGATPLVAVVLCALLWSLGHAQYIVPHGLKEVQIFGLGVLFGWARVRYGLGAAIILHLANNGFSIAMMLLGTLIGVPEPVA